MDQVYSLSLLAALAAGVIGVGAGAAGVLAASARRPGVPLRTLALICGGCGLTALLLGALSALVHLRFGHGPGTPEPMAPLRFLLHHKAYWVVLACALASLAAWAAWRNGGSDDSIHA